MLPILVKELPISLRVREIKDRSPVLFDVVPSERQFKLGAKCFLSARSRSREPKKYPTQ